MTTFSNERVASALSHYVRFAIITSVFVSLLVLLGWGFNISVFRTVLPGLVAMRPVTAVSFLLVSSALWLLRETDLPAWKRRLGFLLAGIVIAVSALVLLEYIFNWNIGIDLWLFPNAVLKDGGLHPGRPAPMTALSLILLSIGLFTLHRRSAALTNLLAVPVLMISLLAIVGYAFGVSSFYRIEPHDSMALHTALLFFLLAIATLSVFPEQTIFSIFITDLAGGISARRLIPAAILIPFVLGCLEIAGQRLGYFGAQFGLALYSTLNIVIFIGFILIIARSLNQADYRHNTAIDSLRVMELQYRRIIEQTPAIVYVDEIGGRWRYISPQLERILGYTVEQWLADPSIFKSRIHKDDGERVYQQIAESESTGKPFVSEYRFSTSAGNILWLHDEAVVLPDPATGKMLLQGVIFNITDRKLAEEQLRYQASLLENVNDAIIASDENYILTAWNSAAEKMYGWKAEEVIGKQGIQIIRSEFLGMNSEELREHIVKRGLYLGEAVQYRKDGTKIHVEVASIVLRDEAGRINGYVSVNRDITERKLTEQNLHALEARYRMLVEQLPTMVYINPINDIGTTTYINPQVETILGYTQKEWLADPKFWMKIIHPDDCLRVLAQVERMDKSGDPFDEEYRLLAKDGRVVWIHDRATLLRDPKGTPLFWQGLMIDLTERKQAEQEREAKLVLEAKNAELDRFAYTVSHDLKSPLVTIQGFLNYFRKDLAAGNAERVLTDLKYVENAVDKMQELLTGVLALSRAGLAIQEPRQVPLGELVHETLELLVVMLETNQAQVNVEENLPVVLGDPLRLRQVLQNLIENAIKYRSPERSPIIEIGTIVRDDMKEKPILFVRDNGKGIPLEYQDKIFDLFHKVDSKSDGSGVGLALVKRIIEVHNGHIWVESEAGKGSTFYFTLPPSG